MILNLFLLMSEYMLTDENPCTYRPCDAQLCKKCPCSHNINTGLIKQISLYDTALAMKNQTFDQ